jgi:formylglycine-generating enzyme required for sulfatase activity/precorrin-6B methylase 2
MNGQLAQSGTRRIMVVLLSTALLVPLLSGDEIQPSQLDVPYEPTHTEVVDLMLQVARVTSSDYVVDLGCGDGRIVIAAAKKFGARGLGIDLDGQRIRESIDNASYAGVSHLVQFKMANIMNVPIHEADVVTMYLLNEVNLMVRPKLFRELRPGTRVVSHAFHMGDWEAEHTAHHPRARGGVVYLWIIPAHVGGTWESATHTAQGEIPTALQITQEFQVLSGLAEFSELGTTMPVQASINGKNLTVTVDAEIKNEKVRIRYTGVVEGDEIHGTQEQLGGSSPGRHPWTARREPADLAGTWELHVPGGTGLDGTIYVARTGEVTAATYVCNDKTSSDAFYLWGRSIRIDAVRGNDQVVFRGVLDSQAGSGTVYRQGWTQEPQWFAKKVSEQVPASFTTPKPEEPLPAPPPPQSVEARRQDDTTPKTPEPNLPARTHPQAGRRWTPAMGAPQPGDEYVNPADGSVLVWIPGGQFVMGDDHGQADERPAHTVSVRGFWLGKFELTNRQYNRFLQARRESRPYHADDPNYGDPNQPVVGVTWLEASRYCAWARLRLPTEAEWEYAARAGAALEYPTSTGAISHSQANIRDVSGPDRWEYTAPVGQFPPNAFGLYDMAGNAWEWTSSAFSPYPYKQGDGREGQELHKLRVLRGGAWSFPPQYCRTTHRHRFAGHLRCDYPGIRVAMTSPPAPSRAAGNIRITRDTR